MKEVIGVCVLLLLIFTVAGCLKTETLEVTIKEKGEKMIGTGKHANERYLVWTNMETFKNTDSLFFFKFNSSDIQGQIIAGGKYTIKVYGYRVPFLSMYRNIVSVDTMRTLR